MKISARNVLRGKVKSITRGGESCEVMIEVAKGVEIVSTVSPSTIDDLELAVGREALAVFNSWDTLVGIPHHKRGE